MPPTDILESELSGWIVEWMSNKTDCGPELISLDVPLSTLLDKQELPLFLNEFTQAFNIDLTPAQSSSTNSIRSLVTPFLR